MTPIIYFTIYVIIISSLAWWVNEPKTQFYNGGIIPSDNPIGENRILRHREHFVLKTGSIISGPNIDKIDRLEKLTEEAFTILKRSVDEANKSISELKTAMDKVCDEN